MTLQSLSRALTNPPRALFFDIDDTLSTHGQLTAKAFAALWRAHDAGIRCVAVTGRPAGWCDHIARFWPVAGVVGENGACAFYHDGRKLRRLDVLSAKIRAANRRRLTRLGKHILRAVPGASIASDQAYRDYDLAIDFCEDVPRLSSAKVERIITMFRGAGANAKLSSIHVNGWFGDYDKLTMSKRFAERVLRLAVRTGWPGFVYVGDSPNDQPLFRAFDLSVGVANVRQFLPLLRDPPKFVTRSESGAGFCELIACLLRQRRPVHE